LLGFLPSAGSKWAMIDRSTPKFGSFAFGPRRKFDEFSAEILNQKPLRDRSPILLLASIGHTPFSAFSPFCPEMPANHATPGIQESSIRYICPKNDAHFSGIDVVIIESRAVRRHRIGVAERTGARDMHLNHLNLPVADIAASRDFLAKYFGMETTMELGRNTFAMMKDDGGMVLVLSYFDKKSEIRYHDDFHIGFFLDTRDAVDALHALMSADGIATEAPKALPGRYAFYVQAPGGFVTEVARLEGARGGRRE
jgi:catechol 2,3-dioxygenase-like lactoylglutathione lyase family enzyme